MWVESIEKTIDVEAKTNYYTLSDISKINT